jgi:BolA protein
MTTRAERIEAAISSAYPGAAIRVEDDSRRHAGHAGAAPGGETHYNLLVVSDGFSGLTRVARSRAVHALLAAEFGTGLHALSLTLKTPAEAGG